MVVTRWPTRIGDPTTTSLRNSERHLHVHKCDSGADAEENIVVIGTVNNDERTHDGRCAGTLFSLNLQALLAVFLPSSNM